MFESDNRFLTGSALESLSEWSNVLKTFQSRIGQYFARLEARQSAFDYLQALMSPVARKNGWQMALAGGTTSDTLSISSSARTRSVGCR